MTSVSFRQRFSTAAAVAVIAGSLSAVNAVGSPHGDHGPDPVSGTISSTVTDAEYLLGEGLLGLDPAVVDDLVADPAFAASVSSDLRSGDPYVIDDALSAIATRTAAEPSDPDAAMVGVNSIVYMSHSVIDVVDSRKWEYTILSSGSQPLGDLISSEGIEREMAISLIVETLGRT